MTNCCVVLPRLLAISDPTDWLLHWSKRRSMRGSRQPGIRARCREARESAEAVQRAAEEASEAARLASEAVNARAVAVESAMERMRGEEAGRKQRFGLLHSAFAKEKAEMQLQLEAVSQRAQECQLSQEQQRKVCPECWGEAGFPRLATLERVPRFRPNSCEML